MRFVRFSVDGKEHLGVEIDNKISGLSVDDAAYPGSLDALVGDESALKAAGEKFAAALRSTKTASPIFHHS